MNSLAHTSVSGVITGCDEMVQFFDWIEGVNLHTCKEMFGDRYALIFGKLHDYVIPIHQIWIGLEKADKETLVDYWQRYVYLMAKQKA